jgi:uncharacterized membrane protein
MLIYAENFKTQRKLISVVPPNDYLSSMAWVVTASGLILGLAAIILPYDKSSASVQENARQSRLSFAIALAILGGYMFMAGMQICFIWPFTFSGGVYNVLFGGIATNGGIVLLAGAFALLLNSNLKPISYLAAVSGVFAIVDAYAILIYALTDSPPLAALGYLSYAAPALLSLPATHSKNKYWRYLFAVFAFLFAAAWLVQAASYTLAHLQPP